MMQKNPIYVLATEIFPPTGATREQLEKYLELTDSILDGFDTRLEDLKIDSDKWSWAKVFARECKRDVQVFSAVRENILTRLLMLE